MLIQLNNVAVITTLLHLIRNVTSSIASGWVVLITKHDSCLCVSFCLSVSLSVSVFLSVWLSDCLSVCLSVCLSFRMPVFLSVCLCESVCPFVSQSACRSVSLSVCLYVFLSVCLPFSWCNCQSACMSDYLSSILHNPLALSQDKDEWLNFEEQLLRSKNSTNYALLDILKICFL